MGVIALLTVALFAAPVAVAHTGASYDAHAHRLSAHGAAAADLRTPSATVARVKAEREARAQAEQKLTAALTTLGGPREPDDVDKLLADAKISDERLGSDGSVELTLTLSTEGLTLKRHHHKKPRE
jgi:hypothetical protein